MDGTGITYGSYDMQTSNVITAHIGDSQPLVRSLNVMRRMRRAGAITTDDTYNERVIPVNGQLESTSDTALEGLIDDFKAAMANKGASLDIDYEGGTRRYVATPQSVVVERPVRASNWANFSVEFLITEFGKSTSISTPVNAVNKTASPATQAMTIDGSAPQQYVIITIDINTLTGASLNTLVIGNNNTGQAVSISRTWTAGEQLVVDVEQQACWVDGDLVDFNGAFPYFEPGSETLSYSDDLTARNIDITVEYVKRWL